MEEIEALSIMYTSIILWSTYFMVVVASYFIYRDYLKKGFIGKKDKLFFTITLIVISFGIYYPFFILWQNLMIDRVAFIMWYVVFLILGISMKLYYENTGCKYEVKKFEINDIEFVVCRSDKINAWFDQKARKIIVSDSFYRILSGNEIRAVIYHEEGHKKLRYLEGIGRFFYYLWIIAMIIYTVLLLVSRGPFYISLLVILLLIFPLMAAATLTSGLLSWLNEHEADTYAVKHVSKESISSALLKFYIYSRMEKYVGSIHNFDVSVNYHWTISDKDILKNLLKLSISFPLTIFELIRRPVFLTHPSLELRLYRILRTK